MKKLVILMAAYIFGGLTVNAQTVNESSFWDNCYIGINGGANFKTTYTSTLKNLNPSIGIILGKSITPIYGLAANLTTFLDNSPAQNTKNTFKGSNLTLLHTINLFNLFTSYRRTSRAFEIVAIAGTGWGHEFRANTKDANYISTKFGLNLNFNMGMSEAWLFNVEPSITYALAGHGIAKEKVGLNINRSYISIAAGLTYKFGNSDGAHNFTIAQMYDQSEVDALNAKINDLRAQANAKDQIIANKNANIVKLNNKLKTYKDKKSTPSVAIKKYKTLQPIVVFRQGKSTIDATQYANIAVIAKYMEEHKSSNILIIGYASTEGDKDINQKLSVARAENIKNILITKYKINADRLLIRGMGSTNELFDETELNRAVTFMETSSQ